MPHATRRLRRVAAVAVAAIATAIAAGAVVIATNDNKGDEPSSIPSAAATATAPKGVDAQERATLLYMREEEKLARDVYLTLAITSGDRRFTNIARSEQQHMDAVGALLTRYGIDDPVAGRDQGEFADAGLQRIHDELVARGTTSPAAALGVGRDIERMDLRDLADRRAHVSRDDLAWVMDRLAAGSQQHLRAFSR
jgi:hypothetical protein